MGGRGAAADAVDCRQRLGRARCMMRTLPQVGREGGWGAVGWVSRTKNRSGCITLPATTAHEPRRCARWQTSLLLAALLLGSPSYPLARGGR